VDFIIERKRGGGSYSLELPTCQQTLGKFPSIISFHLKDIWEAALIMFYSKEAKRVECLAQGHPTGKKCNL
jgi:hypothetical protein